MDNKKKFDSKPGDDSNLHDINEDSTIEYDVVIVGSGVAGCVLAKTLTQAGKKVLLLEAGLEAGMNMDRNGNYYNYMDYLNTFYSAMAKVPNSPYPNIPDAPSINVLDIEAITGTNSPSTEGYLVQAGPLPFGSDCLRGPGGTTLHWLGTTPRMLPNDFKMQTNYGVGVDWPISYDDLKRYYEMAELEIGVSGNVDEQQGPDVSKDKNYGKDYCFPMDKIPQSYLDEQFMSLVKELNQKNPIKVNGKPVEVTFTPTPQGRNSIPNGEYPYVDVWWDKSKKQLVLVKDKYWNKDAHGFAPVDTKYEYHPVGSNWDPNTGLRCEGNASCVPICPVQAKYNALKSLGRADHFKLSIKTQSVASRVLIDDTTKEVTGIEYKTYAVGDAIVYETFVAKAKYYVLGASAIENAKILLASDAANSSGEVGCNLMDHLCVLTWGLLPVKGYPFRGPGSTTNIPTWRDGEFRKDHSAWICPVDNWGWGWPTFAPGSDVANALTLNMFGTELREHIADVVPRQLLLHYECEQLPDKDNRVTIDPTYRDPIGNYRPVIHYNVTDYEKRAFATAMDINTQLFDGTETQDFTSVGPSNPDFVSYMGKGYNFSGAGHIVGTHRMGFNKKDSVVDKYGCCWDHNNLYLIGCGNMPTLGTSNPTLTMTALTFKTAEAILNKLQK